MNLDTEKRCVQKAQEFVNNLTKFIYITDYLSSDAFETEEEYDFARRKIEEYLKRPFPKDMFPPEWYCSICHVKRVRYGLNCKECEDKKKEVKSDVVGLGISEIANNDT